jgi:hypothetical protein
MNHPAPASPPITALLRSKGKNTIGHETNLARSPIWQARALREEAETVVSPVLFGHPFRKVEGLCLTTGDQRLFAHLTTAFVRLGCPDTRQVPFSLGDAALTMRYETTGGRQRALIRASLGRLRSVTFESALRHPDGEETVLGWGLIDSYLVTTKGGGKGWVKLSETVAQLLREGSVTLLHAPTWEAICAEDDVAGRLWTFLESENIGGGWRYSLFRADRVDGGSGSSMPTIAEVLQLGWTSRKRRIAQRVREACSVVERHDPRYRLNLAAGSLPGSWVLTCTRSRTSRQDRRAPIPQEVVQAWRLAYHSHLPSRRQHQVLTELLERRTVEWIVSELQSGDDDPFDSMMQTDRDLSASDIVRARSEEESWAAAKERESSTAEQSLLDLLGEVRSHLYRD